MLSEASGFPKHLESLNIGNNLFGPSDLLKLSKIALTSGRLPSLKKLAIAFSDFG